MDERGFFSHCVPKKFSEVTLDQCDKQPDSFREYAKAWGRNPESVILTGPVGRGKTQFAFAMIREMFRRCNRVIWPRYFTSPEMDSLLLEAIKSDGGDKFKIQDIGEQDLLFIDDFGRETGSERIRRQYFEIINLRYANHLPTLISTNLSLEEIEKHMNKAIASRFQEWQMIEFGGVDLRIQRKLC
jgi:DNA replication protein DnaC